LRKWSPSKGRGGLTKVSLQVKRMHIQVGWQTESGTTKRSLTGTRIVGAAGDFKSGGAGKVTKKEPSCIMEGWSD